MVLLVDHDPQLAVGQKRRPRPDRPGMLQAGQLPGDHVTLVQQLPLDRFQRVQAEQRGILDGPGLVTHLQHPLEDRPPIGVARPGREREPLEIPRQPHPRRQHDAAVGAARVEPGDAAVAHETEIDAHSNTRIRSRSSAASSKFSASTARWSCSRNSARSRRSSLVSGETGDR